jgi:hypothetical protein
VTKLVRIDPKKIVFCAPEPVEPSDNGRSFAKKLYTAKVDLLNEWNYKKQSSMMCVQGVDDADLISGECSLEVLLITAVDDFKKEAVIKESKHRVLKFKYIYDECHNRLLVHTEHPARKGTHSFFSKKETVVYYDQDSGGLYYWSPERSILSHNEETHSPTGINVYVRCDDAGAENEPVLMQHTEDRRSEDLITGFVAARMNGINLGELSHSNRVPFVPAAYDLCSLDGRPANFVRWYVSSSEKINDDQHAATLTACSTLSDYSTHGEASIKADPDSLAGLIASFTVFGNPDGRAHNFLCPKDNCSLGLSQIVHFDYGDYLVADILDQITLDGVEYLLPDGSAVNLEELCSPPWKKYKHIPLFPDIKSRLKSLIQPWADFRNIYCYSLMQQEGFQFAEKGGLGLGSKNIEEIHSFIVSLLSSLQLVIGHNDEIKGNVDLGLKGRVSDDYARKIDVLSELTDKRLDEVKKLLSNSEELLSVFDFTFTLQDACEGYLEFFLDRQSQGKSPEEQEDLKAALMRELNKMLLGDIDVQRNDDELKSDFPSFSTQVETIILEFPEKNAHAERIYHQAQKVIRLWRRRELFANFVCNKRFPDPMQKLLVAQFSALEFSDIRVDSKVAALIGKILPVFKSEKKDEITEIDAMCGHSEKTLQELESFAQNGVAAEVGRNAFFPVINHENPGKNTCNPKPLSPTSITDDVN